MLFLPRYEQVTIGVPKELTPLERCVAQTPESIGKLTKAGFNVVVEKGAGEAASFSDALYTAAGAKIVSREEAYKASLVTKVIAPTPEEAALIEDKKFLANLDEMCATKQTEYEDRDTHSLSNSGIIRRA